MRATSCEGCPHLSGERCLHKGRPLAKITGCSLSKGGQTFFRSKSGAEAIRREIGKRKSEGV